MLSHSHTGSSGGNKNCNLFGFGSAYSFPSYLDTLHRGYGWVCLMDSDDYSWPIIAAFDREAAHITTRMKHLKEAQCLPTWH